jgi:anti-anti-sigma regulatory factor
MDDCQITVAWPARRTAVVTVVGDHDFLSGSLFRHTLAETSAKAGCVIVDLLETTFIDSHMLSELAAARNAHPEVRILLAVAPRSHPDSLLRIVGFDRLFEIHPTVAEALAACAAHVESGSSVTADLTRALRRNARSHASTSSSPSIRRSPPTA